MPVVHWPPESKFYAPDLVSYLPGGPDRHKAHELGNRPKRRLRKMQAAGYTYPNAHSPVGAENENK